MKLIFTVHTGKAKVIPLFYLYENHACKGALGIKEKNITKHVGQNDS